MQDCILSRNIFLHFYHTPPLQRHSFITTQFILYLRRRQSRVGLYLSEVETKRPVSMFRVYFNINRKATRNGLAVRIFPATMRTFTKDTALSEHSRGTALWGLACTLLYILIFMFVDSERQDRMLVVLMSHPSVLL